MHTYCTCSGRNEVCMEYPLMQCFSYKFRIATAANSYNEATPFHLQLTINGLYVIISGHNNISQFKTLLLTKIKVCI